MVGHRRALLFCVLWAAICAPGAYAQPTSSITGVVTDASDRPLADVLIYVDSGSHFSRTDSSGVFRLDGIPGGPRTLSYRLSGYAPRTFSLQAVGGETRNVGTVRLGAGEDPAAVLSGRVSEPIGGAPLQGATVELNGELVAETDSAGLFRLTDTPVLWGTNQLRIRHRLLADAEVRDDFWVGYPNEVFEFDVTLDVPPISLPGVTVESARPVPSRLRGFYERKEDGGGTFLERTDIEARSLRRVSDLFTRFRSSSRSRASGTFGRAASGNCEAPLVFVDGQLIGSDMNPLYVDDSRKPNINDLVHPDDLEAVEMYDTVARIPSTFDRSGSVCGVIAIWTR